MNLKSLSSKVAEKAKEAGSAIVNTEFSDMKDKAVSAKDTVVTKANKALDKAQEDMLAHGVIISRVQDNNNKGEK